MKTSKNSRISD